MSTPTAPIDQTHQDSIDATRWVRQQTNAARRRLGLPVRRYGKGWR